MKRALLLFAMALLAMAVTVCAGGVAGAAGAAGPPPGPPPPYQMRAPLPAGDRLTRGKDGAALFSNRCGACHLAGGMGTNLLTKQRVMLGEPPEKALLANRTDLTQDYVKIVVRRGKLAMPSLTRVEVTDAELDAIARLPGQGVAMNITRRSVLKGALVTATAAVRARAACGWPPVRCSSTTAACRRVSHCNAAMPAARSIWPTSTPTGGERCAVCAAAEASSGSRAGATSCRCAVCSRSAAAACARRRAAADCSTGK